ncbi:MAG: phosphoribosyltransferase [Gammaproteobacteria bacterium]
MDAELPAELISWDEVYSLCRRLSWELRNEKFRIDTIIAIARGGYVPGRLLSDMLGIHDLTGFKIEHYQNIRKQQEAFVKYPLNADLTGKNILLVDDVCDSGDTFAVGIEHIRQIGPPGEIRTAALHLKAVSKFIPDFFVENVREWRWIIYPWAVNEDLSTMLMNLQCDYRDRALLQRLIKERHGIEVAARQIDDALALIRQTESQ